MKYIENEKFKKDRFVTGFTVKGSEIKIKFANGSKMLVPNVEENRKKVLSRMDEQALVISKQEGKFITNQKTFKKTIPSTILATGLATGATVIGTLTNSPVSEISIGVGALVGCGVIYKIGANINNHRKLTEVTKAKFAAENKDFLNQNINQSKNTLYGVSRKIKKAVKSPNIKGEPIDMNLIDKLSLQDLKDLLSNIKREQEFAFVMKPAKVESEKVKGLF